MIPIELFIEEVRKYECLYDVNNEDYKNVFKKKQLWQAIGNRCGSTAEECKKRWKGLRDTYMRRKRNSGNEERRSKCGSCTTQPTPKQWRYVKNMSFLENFPNIRRKIDWGPYASCDDAVDDEDTVLESDNMKLDRTIENVTLVADEDNYLEENYLTNIDDESTTVIDSNDQIIFSKPSSKRKTYEDITDQFSKMVRQYVNTVREIAFTCNETTERNSTSLALELVAKRISDANIPKSVATSIENKILALVDDEIEKYRRNSME